MVVAVIGVSVIGKMKQMNLDWPFIFLKVPLELRRYPQTVKVSEYYVGSPALGGPIELDQGASV
jgi:hypothetical protein